MTVPVEPNIHRRGLRAVVTGAVVAAAVAAAAAGFLYLDRDNGDSGTVTASDPAIPAAVSRAAGVEAIDSSVNLGRVPVNTTVDQVFRLRNAGTGQAIVGRPKIETLEGC